MARKRKKTVRLEEDEVVVVGAKDRWEHLIMVYRTLAEDAPAQDKAYWYEAAEWIEANLNREAIWRDSLEEEF